MNKPCAGHTPIRMSMLRRVVSCIVFIAAAITATGCAEYYSAQVEIARIKSQDNQVRAGLYLQVLQAQAEMQKLEASKPLVEYTPGTGTLIVNRQSAGGISPMMMSMQNQAFPFSEIGGIRESSGISAFTSVITSLAPIAGIVAVGNSLENLVKASGRPNTTADSYNTNTNISANKTDSHNITDAFKTDTHAININRTDSTVTDSHNVDSHNASSVDSHADSSSRPVTTTTTTQTDNRANYENDPITNPVAAPPAATGTVKP